MHDENIIASLDLGSSKTVALISRFLPSGEMELIGIGIATSTGIKAGAVTNIEKTVASIKEAVEEAELMSAEEITDVIINISGKHLKGDNSPGVIAITNKEKIVTTQDIYRVIEAARSVRIPADQEILHVLAKEFKVDDQTGIKDPTGMVGFRLEADVHVVTGSVTQIQNTENAVNEAGIEVYEKVISALASSQSFLSEDEKEMGVAVIDIGAGEIDIIIYVDGGVAYTSTINLGGQHITQDISIGLKTPMEAAEVLKKRDGIAEIATVDPMETVEVPSVGNRNPRAVPRKELANIIEARLREILELVNLELLKSGKKAVLAGGVIFTGGVSLTEGLIQLAEEVIQLQSSVGYPKGLSGISDKISSPVFATVVGLLHYGSKNTDKNRTKKKGNNFVGRMKSWLQDNL